MFRYLPLLLLTVATPVAAAPFQDTAAIDRAVAAFTGVPTGAAGGARTPVDARLRLAACPMVSLAWRSEAHDAVVVTCTGPEWRIFAAVRTTPAAPKPAAPLVIVPSETAAPLKPVYVIKRGDPVTISAGSPGFSITREGVASGDAVAGGRFLVRVEDTRAPVQAVAVAGGRATLPGWAE